jgi:hypothetical protein
MGNSVLRKYLKHNRWYIANWVDLDNIIVYKRSFTDKGMAQLAIGKLFTHSELSVIRGDILSLYDNYKLIPLPRVSLESTIYSPKPLTKKPREILKRFPQLKALKGPHSNKSFLTNINKLFKQ